MKKIAFYAPVKPPDHPIPSGDREISRLLIKAMEYAGHDVHLASKFIAYQKRPGDELFELRNMGGQEEANRLLSTYLDMPPQERPDVWFTYHTYCKAPDYLGPHISRALNIPYVTAEACRTRQNTDADWKRGRDIVQKSIRHADINFCLKPSDRVYLDSVLDTNDRVVDLPPFVDEALIQADANSIATLPFADDKPVILTAGMMRPGKKLQCYQILAEALRLVPNQDWNLIVVGDGPERENIAGDFSFIPPERIHWTGLVNPVEVHGYMAKSDIFAWPGYREPIGMVYLEAQTLGVSVAAMASLGVPTVVEHDKGGLLSTEGNIQEYADIIDQLLQDKVRRKQLGEAGRTYVKSHHGIKAAAKLISSELEKL